MKEQEWVKLVHRVVAGVKLEGLTIEGGLGIEYSNDETDWGLVLKDPVSGTEVAMGYGRLAPSGRHMLPRKGWTAWYDKPVYGDRDTPPDVDVVTVFEGSDMFSMFQHVFTYFMKERLAAACERLADELYVEPEN